MILCPARLEPVFYRRPWGALSLDPFFPEKKNLAEPVGEAWMTGSDCVFANGPFQGRALGQAWPEMPVEWSGKQLPRGSLFPLLVKFIFSEQKLSIQVHPDDAYAEKHEQAAGGRGKTEMWYVMRAAPGAEVLVGLRPEATREKFERAILDNTAELWLEHWPVTEGEAIFVPAGTVHTIGPGLALCEIQQHSDLTYRVYDYDRRDSQGRARQLHVKKALDVIRFGEQRGGKIEAARTERDGVRKSCFAGCRYFATEKWEFEGCVRSTTSSRRFELLILLEGRGQFCWSGQSAGYAPMQVWLIPAALGAFELAPDSPTSLLRTYIPGELDEWERDLAGQGIDAASRARLVQR